jgi:GlcNAc-P-P-Und epimerase
MTRKVLITGSSGFIGGHLVDLLLRQGYELLGIDIQPEHAVRSSGYSSQMCDICDRTALAAAVSSFKPESVVHLAARTDLYGRTVADYAANSVGVENLVSVISETPSIARCIFTSSQLVCRIGYVPKDDQDYAPNTPYGASKVLTERIVRRSDGGSVEWCLVRPTTIWGPGMNEHYQSFFKLVRGGRYFHVGRDPLYKSYGYVGNTVYQYLCFINAPASQIHRRLFYVADYQPTSLREWANEFQREFDAPRILTVPTKLAVLLAKLGDTANAVGYRKFPFNSFRLRNILTEYQYDLSQTQAICGKLPYDVYQGVKETAAWLTNIS